MRAPLAPSSHYRSQRMVPVFWSGLVLWMNATEYRKVKESEMWGTQATDATNAQIEAQDQWYEQAKAERESEFAELERLFRRSR